MPRAYPLPRIQQSLGPGLLGHQDGPVRFIHKPCPTFYYQFDTT